MTAAILRLFTILLTSVIIIGGSLIFLRWLGSSQEFAPLNHPLAQRPYLVFAESGAITGDTAQTLSAIKKLIQLCPDCIPKLDARRSADGQWYAFPTPDLSERGRKDTYFSLMSSKDIDAFGDVPKIKQVVEAFPDTPFMVVVHSRDASQLNEILKALESRGTKENIVLHSPFRQMLTDARKQRPTWLFGVSPTGLARLVMMEALFIEPMANIWSDLIISPVEVHDINVFTPRLIAEFKRRHKLLILENPGPLDQLPGPLKAAINGVVTPNISEALSFFRSRPAKSN